MKKDGVEKKDNTKGKVKGYFMYEKEKQRENHLIVLLVYTFFSLILTGEQTLTEGLLPLPERETCGMPL